MCVEAEQAPLHILPAFPTLGLNFKWSLHAPTTGRAPPCSVHSAQPPALAVEQGLGSGVPRLSVGIFHHPAHVREEKVEQGGRQRAL